MIKVISLFFLLFLVVFFSNLHAFLSRMSRGIILTVRKDLGFHSDQLISSHTEFQVPTISCIVVAVLL